MQARKKFRMKKKLELGRLLSLQNKLEEVWLVFENFHNFLFKDSNNKKNTGPELFRQQNKPYCDFKWRQTWSVELMHKEGRSGAEE